MKAVWIALVLFAIQTAFAADDVGRVRLVLPEGEWVTVAKIDAPLVYGGDSPGSIKSQRLVKVLAKDKTIQALLFVYAGEYGIAKGTMNWSSTRCKQENSEYRVDATQGSFTRLDCLKVFRDMTPEAWLKKNAAATHAELVNGGYKFAPRAFQVTNQIGTDNGTFIFSNALIAHSALMGIPDAEKGAKYAGMPGVAWGQQLALAARDSVTSLSGELKVPAIYYDKK